MSLRSKMLAMSTIPVVVLVFAVDLRGVRAADRVPNERRGGPHERGQAAARRDPGRPGGRRVERPRIPPHRTRPGMRAAYESAVDRPSTRPRGARSPRRPTSSSANRSIGSRSSSTSGWRRSERPFAPGADRTPEAQARLVTSLLHGQTITDALRGLTEQMRVTADELAAERIAARDAAFERSYLVQVLAMPAAIFVAMILMVGFTGGHRETGRQDARQRRSGSTRAAARRPGLLAATSSARSPERSSGPGSHLSELQEELRQHATVDELTGLANRRGFFALGEHELLVAARTRSSVALLFVDVDGLKNVNDELGHVDRRPAAQGGGRRDPRDHPRVRSSPAASAATSSACS